MTDHTTRDLQVLPLTAFDLIAVSGDDARKFLQGQVTCDVDLLTPSRSLKGAICNLKGRVISDFRLVDHKSVCYLILAAEMGETVKSVLDKYIVFSKAQCQLLTGQLRRTGIMGSDAQPLLESILGSCPESAGAVCTGDGMLCIRIPGLIPRFELWQFASGSGQPPELPTQLAELGPETSDHAWELEDVRAGIVHITPQLTELHLPEALNYDLSGVVNFKKGCYTGQEIVARMYYRGTAKRRLYTGIAEYPHISPESISCRLMASDTMQEGEAGSDLESESDSKGKLSGETKGELIKSLQDSDGNWQILAILPTVAAETLLLERQAGSTGTPGNEGRESGNVFLNNEPELSVRLQSLPYVVNATGT